MTNIDEFLAQFADNDADYERDGDAVQLTRSGREWLLELKELPDQGLCIRSERHANNAWVPSYVFLQQHLLELPILANQIAKRLGGVVELNQRYVDSRGEVSSFQADVQKVNSVRSFLNEIVESPDFGVTTLILLMAPAGQGKTVLLQRLALDSCLGFSPSPRPTPILLTIDLVGRYVGTVVDAIAGTLNKTIQFPLGHRDVIAAVRMGWIALALDGFDELTARIGSRDAFLRITELLNELNGKGIVVLSARGSFFEQYRIRHAIRSHLAPRRGDFKTLEVSLLDWNRKEGALLLRKHGISSPDQALDDIIQKFDGDEALVLQPFFLTRLARLLQEGETFEALSAESDVKGKIRFAIDAILQREVTEKWRTKEGKPLLSVEEHYVFLRGIAGEMWRASALRLDWEELELVCQMAGEEGGVETELVDECKSRFASHALLISADGTTTFVHQKFFEYFAATAFATFSLEERLSDLRAMLEAQEISIEFADWVVWRVGRGGCHSLVTQLSGISSGSMDPIAVFNCGLLVARVLCENGAINQVHGLTFSGECLAGAVITNVLFERCALERLDLVGTSMDGCRFVDCTIRDVRIDHRSAGGVSIEDCKIYSIDFSDTPVFDPDRVVTILRATGATIINKKDDTPYRSVDDDKIKLVARLCRIAEKSAEFSLEETEERLGSEGARVIKLAMKAGVLSNSRTKSTKGSRREFVRFIVDKNELLRGSSNRTRVSQIEAFWDSL